MFDKVLIANRGEIALRVIRACRELGVRTVAAYSEADREALPVRLADERICIGPGPSSKSYLHIPNIISAALLTHSQAIHPGYGFLSENPSFAETCADCGLVFIGPPAAAMVKMGDKVEAREAMSAAGLPMLPGTEVLRSMGEGEEAAERIGFPLMLKAAAGGGGRGIRLVHRPEEFAHVFTTAQSEVREAFHDDGLYIEKYLGHAKHVELQVFCDNYGNGAYLGERNCSTQRRHQKLVEESPSPGLPEKVRRDMGQRAIQAALAIGYRGAGTMEFLVDEDNYYYFMEMNTRLQVEHPVTELVTGLDLVHAQLRVAAGERLPFSQEDVELRGHAIEFRITAEDPALDFRPQTGTIEEYLPPSGPGVRVDSHLYRTYEVPPHYDSLLAKLIVWAPTRAEAIARGRRALNEFVIEGVPTTIPFHLKLLDNPVFLRGEVYTNFLAEHSADFALNH
ncbi:MAG TPA: acetyl-CoA carboxylase biotin carboxylase subunit [Ktedonobacterales bacterium]|jgi:acetyl-CoA carboxylase biotin carboxylase subunit|nr:acetyl-CoA carboxylase biotin carboxylase subunit [Ktedonobacterales bacterium]